MNYILFKITINGELQEEKRLPETMRLLDYLHEEVGLTGTKFSCGVGLCGACTIAVKETPDKQWGSKQSCSLYIKDCNGWEVKTVEGLSTTGELHPLQVAFISNYAFQCGYCTPGFLMAGYVLLEKIKSRAITIENLDNAIYEAVDAHICRCTGYKRYYTALKICAMDEIELMSREYY